MNKLRFLSLASGSSGNCYFVGNAHHGILIDAGIGIRNIKKRLKEHGYGLENILGVFITHDHFDHIRAAGTLGEKYHLPIYSTEKILGGINQNYGITEKLYTCKRSIEMGTTIVIADFAISSFPISHDATESLGYTIEYNNLRFTLATDLGYICENAAAHIRQANYLVIESNFDSEMLQNSRYPLFLRERIAGEKGHLCNDETAIFLAENYQNHLQYIYLCHLSRNNNTPEKAFEKVKTALAEKGIVVGRDVELVALPRTKCSEFYIYD